MTMNTYRGEFDEPDTLHLYAYCANNPINYIDPSGHKYDRSKVMDYVLKWWNGHNPDYRYIKGHDCANFVSQCVKSGGKKMDDISKEKGWYYKGLFNFSTSWTYVPDQYKYFKRHWQRGKVVRITTKQKLKSVLKSPSHKGIKKGDICYMSKHNRKLSQISHSTIVTDINSKGLYYGAHTDSHKIQSVYPYIIGDTKKKVKWNIYVLKLRSSKKA